MSLVKHNYVNNVFLDLQKEWKHPYLVGVGGLVDEADLPFERHLAVGGAAGARGDAVGTTRAAVKHPQHHLPIFKDVEDRLLEQGSFAAAADCGWIHGSWRNHLQTKMVKHDA